MRLALLTSLLLFCATSHATVKEELASPWTTPARPYLLTGTFLTVSLVLLDHEIDEPFQRSTTRHKPLGDGWVDDTGDYAGRLIPNAIYTGGMAIAYWASHDPATWRRAGLMLRASAYSAAAAQILKYSIQEERPNKGDRLSFPSGHTASAFTFATVVAAEHGIWPYGVPALALATLTGYSRINDNQHYLHDVVAGATIGAAFGLGVCYVNRTSTESGSARFQVLPIIDHERLGLLYAASFP